MSYQNKLEKKKTSCDSILDNLATLYLKEAKGDRPGGKKKVFIKHSGIQKFNIRETILQHLVNSRKRRARLNISPPPPVCCSVCPQHC